MQQGSSSLKRRLYFISGFDPRGSSFYYRLFVEQLRRYAQRTGRDLSVGRRRGQQDPLLSSWQVHEQGRPVLEVCFMHWDDIVREHWPANPWTIVAQGLDFFLWYLGRGGLGRIVRMCPSVALCGLYPLLFFTACALVIALVSGLLLGVGHGIPSLLALLLLVPLSWRLADQQGVIWLFRVTLFNHRLGQGRDQSLRRRIDQLSTCVLDLEQRRPAARIQLLGYSCGSYVMAMLAAHLRRKQAFEDLEPRLSLLSLGQCLPAVAVYRRAAAFHADLCTLAVEPRIPWRDISSCDDYLCFAAVDPYTSCRLPIDPPGYPQLELVRLAQRLNLRSWWALINNQFPLHYQYLHTAEPALQGGFDYFEHLLGEAD